MRKTTLAEFVADRAWDAFVGNDPEAPLPPSLAKILESEGEDFAAWKRHWQPLREHLQGAIHSALAEGLLRAASTPFEPAPPSAPPDRY